MRRLVTHAIVGLAALLATGVAEPAGANRRREAKQIEIVEARPIGAPLLAIVSLSTQRITIYDANGWILRAPISSGQPGYETPAGVFSVLQKEEEHYSNLYDDASMPFMQRITWSGIALHAGELPGYPASHGCIRMPHEFAQRLFDVTNIGMRVIVARNDVRPAEIEHPLLFNPKPVRADIALRMLTAHWEITRPDEQAATPVAALPGADAPLLANSQEPLVLLKSIAAAKMAEANAAAKKADTARQTAARLTMDALRLVRTAEIAKNRAEAQVRAADGALESGRWPARVQQSEEAKATALQSLAEAEAQLSAAKAEAQLKAAAAARAREEARVAEGGRSAALRTLDEIERISSPVSIFISRKTQRLYVRQAFQPVLEIPITIREADRAIGTHVYTALDYTNGGSGLEWSVVSMQTSNGRQPGSTRKPRHSDGYDAEAMPSDVAPARAALDRIDIPKDIADRISEVISPGSSLIISDEAMSAETGKDTDFVILMSGEPQGGVKIRRRDPEAFYGRQYDRSPYAPWYYPRGPFGPW